jgi:Na+-transporting NADH:ubiquinone oxidoreductase subunit NqrB
VTAATTPTVRFGERDYPVILPSVRDPRLHLAAVIISIHVLGQTALGFRVSVPQILSAILTCFLIDVTLTFRRTGQFVWPASAMLTGSGVALIFRLVGMDRGDHWTWRGWYLFALVAGVSLVTKYVIRYRGTHVFNPSNVGLVVAFLVLTSARVEPLDFWWAPLGGWMVAAYVIILVGGLLITARLRLLGMASAFWASLATGLGLLAASGHCFTAAWALEPVCGFDFWRVVVSSPEILIFLFFMITDPKTIPGGRLARVAFSVCLGLVSTLLIAPQTTEFGAKVGLLAGLMVMSPVRYVFDRLFAQENPRQTRLGALVARIASPSGGTLPPARIFSRGAVLGSLLTFVAVAIVATGAPARELAQSITPAGEPTVTVEVDRTTLPAVTVDPEVSALNSEISAGSAGDLAVTLAENLKIEGEAMRRADTSLLRAADDGERLVVMERRVEAAATLGELVVTEYTFDSLDLRVVFTEGSQGGASLAFEAHGMVVEITSDIEGAELRREESPFETLFVLRQGSGGRWLIVDELPAP